MCDSEVDYGLLTEFSVKLNTKFLRKGDRNIRNKIKFLTLADSTSDFNLSDFYQYFKIHK